MIDKITPRALDKSSDDKFIAKTSMRDALNLYITDDTSDSEGNVGVLKNIKGNSLVNYGFPSDNPVSQESVNKVIGSVTDEKTQICYFFVWSQDPEDQGIWAYDKYGKLPQSKTVGMGAENSLRKIFTSKQFNFPEHGFVKGDIIYTNTNEFEKHSAISQYLEANQNLKVDFEKDVLLYFTDHKNEPRKINVYRALLEKNDALASYDAYGTADFICACPKAPLSRITFEFSPDPLRPTNNFAAAPGFQFAYQNIYKDGVESAISTYSVMAFPPSVVHRGAAQVSDILSHNLCTLTIPPAGPEIKNIRILARYGNTANFFEIDEVSNSTSETENWDLSSRTYKFYNDRVASGVSPKEVDKTFDNLPRKAQAQTAISNRLIYGNYLEGYDNVNTKCDSKVVYNKRPQDFLDLTLRAHPSIEPSNYGDNKCVGFQIDTTQIPNSISAGTIINVSLDYTPDRNFHIYQADETKSQYGSYHQSRQMGKYSSNAVGYRHWPLTQDNNFYYQEGEGNNNSGANNTHSNTPADLQEKGVGGLTGEQDSWRNQNDTGGKYLSVRNAPFFGMNFGVSSEDDFVDTARPLWVVKNTHESDDDVILTNGNNARYGTSAGNPLILKSTPLQFKVKFKLILDIESQGKNLVEETITEALAGADGVTVNNGGGGIFKWANWIEIDTDSDDVQNTVRITKSEYDLQLGYNENDPFSPTFDFKKIMPGDDLSYLICGVGQVGNIRSREPGVNFGDNRDESVPFGYFIINKAEVDFHLELVDEDLHFGSRKHLRLAISKIDVDEDDVMTCFKRLDPTSPWWAIHPSTIQNPNFNGVFTNAEDSIIDTTDENEENWIESVQYKFRLTDPLFFEGLPELFKIRRQFTTKFVYDHEPQGFNTGMGNSSGDRWVNLGFCGYLFTGNSAFFKRPPINMLDVEGNYIPRINQNFFRYSIMDGEGGPGGADAGGNSAYDKYGNSKYGSIAARVDFGYDGSAVEASRGEYDSTFNFFTYPAFVGGSTEVGGGDNIGTTPIGTGSVAVADSETGLGLTEDTQISGLYREKYVVSGPFFTGCIAMNPVVEQDSDAANPQPFPPVKDYTTTLPLVWVNSEGRTLNNNDIVPQNWLRTSYPWPQIIRPTSPQAFTDSQGLIANGQLDLTPFFEPLYYSSGETGDEDTLTLMTGNLIGTDTQTPPPTEHFGSVDFSLTHSAIEGNSQTSFIPGDQEGHMSFKSSATHEFGIVYYDQRGRHGYVNHLDTVYVEGYSPMSRGGNNVQGSAHINLRLLHNPPEWAHNYKIVYSKNTSVSDFIQYSAGGAFTAEGESAAGDPSRIYVSLNYLQGHPISYSSAWGARSKEGGMAIYTPEEGDRLRVVSYMLPPGGTPVPERVYPQNYDFEVSSVVSLGSEENPLFFYDDGELQKPENRQGLFLVIKNNDAANGFRYQDVRDGTHNWKNNCLIEIYSPTKELDAEDRLYYEIGDTYKVVKASDGSLVHEQPDILLTEGDVYFRSAAVNFRDYDDSILDGGLLGYEDIIIDTIEDVDTTNFDEFRASESNFKSYYIESPVATDLFKSDSLSVGRPNIIKHDAQEAYKEASVIHSDRDVTNAGKVSYSSFNRSMPIDQDLDLKSGPINYLVNHDENCLFIQHSKTGHIPIDRSIISDVSGESSLIASSKFLNTPRYYAGRAGAGGNPESVVSIDNAVYFANKSLGEVYKVSGVNGVNVISEKNMKSYFRGLFKNAIDQSNRNGEDVRVVGGYDPLKNEYLITVLDPVTYGPKFGPEFPDQPDGDPESIILGCMDPFATNYDPHATHDTRPSMCKYPTPGCMDPLALNYDETAISDDGSCVYPYTVLPYSNSPCEYDGLKGDSGDITKEGVEKGYETVTKSIKLDPSDSKYMSPYEASLFYPDFNGDEEWTVEDLRTGLELAPIFCPGGAPQETLASVSYSWENFSTGEITNIKDNISSSYLYAGQGAETIGLIPGFILGTNPEVPPALRIDLHNLHDLNAGEEIHVHIGMEENDDVEFTNLTGGPTFDGPYNGDTSTMWTIDFKRILEEGTDEAAYLASIGTLEEIHPNREYILKISGDTIVEFIQSNGYHPSQTSDGVIYAHTLGPVSSQGEWLCGVPAPELIPPWNYYPQPMLLEPTEFPFDDIEDVIRTNSIDIGVLHSENLPNENYGSRGSMSLSLGWQPFIYPGSKSSLPPVVQFVDIDQPFPFTGNICDYPLIIDENSFPIWGTDLLNVTTELQAQISDPDNPMTQIEATHHYPNFAFTSYGLQTLGGWGPQWPNGSGGYQGFEGGILGPDLRDYFIENDGLGDSLNFEAYNTGIYGAGEDGGLGEPFLQSISAQNHPDYETGVWNAQEMDNHRVQPIDKYALQAWLQYLAASSGVTVSQLPHCPAPPPPCDNCAILLYQNNACDYPALIDSAGYITAASIQQAFMEVTQDISDGIINHAEATFIFPDVSGLGVINVDDLMGVIQELPLPCSPPPPYTGNPCDYPLLLETTPQSPYYGSISRESLALAAEFTFDQMVQGIWSPNYATFFFPDMTNDGIISTIDLLMLLEQAPIDCSELPGEPPFVKPETTVGLEKLAVKKLNKKEKNGTNGRNETNGGNYAI